MRETLQGLAIALALVIVPLGTIIAVIGGAI